MKRSKTSEKKASKRGFFRKFSTKDSKQVLKSAKNLAREKLSLFQFFFRTRFLIYVIYFKLSSKTSDIKLRLKNITPIRKYNHIYAGNAAARQRLSKLFEESSMLYISASAFYGHVYRLLDCCFCVSDILMFLIVSRRKNTYVAEFTLAYDILYCFWLAPNKCVIMN